MNQQFSGTTNSNYSIKLPSETDVKKTDVTFSTIVDLTVKSNTNPKSASAVEDNNEEERKISSIIFNSL